MLNFYHFQLKQKKLNIFIAFSEMGGEEIIKLNHLSIPYF